MLESKNENKHFNKEIPFNIQLPKQLKLSNDTKLFIYIPNYKEITLSVGKNFENGFWSITYQELETTNFIISSNISFFQFLIIHKNSSEEEIISNIYFQNNNFYIGPFISADFTIINETNINLRIKSIVNPNNTKFIIDGIPNDAILSFGKKENDNIWVVDNIYYKNLLLKLAPNSNIKKLHLAITGINKETPRFNTTFNLIININEPSISYKMNYKEITIPTLEILQKTNLKFDDYILSIKNFPDNCCIENQIIIENKWLIKGQSNKEIVLKCFDIQKKDFFITLEYLLINHNTPTFDDTYTIKYKCNLEDKKILTKDYTKCIICKSMPKCILFKEFMNYIGNSTILKHIVPK